jgi:single-strand DNA-binding protein
MATPCGQRFFRPQIAHAAWFRPERHGIVVSDIRADSRSDCRFDDPTREFAMNETVITLTGAVTTDVEHRVSGRGVHIASFRLTASGRRSERDQPLQVTVTCWRQLAENVAASVARGQPVVVTGRLRVRSRDLESGRLVWAELDAQTVGHDLSQGTAAFRRNVLAEEPASSGEQEILDEMTVRLAYECGAASAADPAESAPAPEGRDTPGDAEPVGAAPPRADAA